MQKPEFDSAGYGNVVTTSVQNAVSRIVSVGDQEIKEAPRVAAVPEAVGYLVSGAASQGTLDGFDAAVSPLREGANAEGAIRDGCSSPQGHEPIDQGDRGKGKG